MADRYWVGGTGVWNGTNTANWSATSGGAPGASVPTSADDVYINGASDAGGAYIIVVDAACVCKTLSIYPDQLLTLRSNKSHGSTQYQLNIHGSLYTEASPSLLDMSDYRGSINIQAASGAITVDTGGNLIGGNGIYFPAASSATFSLGSALNIPDGRFQLVDLGSSFTSNNHNITCDYFEVGGATTNCTLGTSTVYTVNIDINSSAVLSQASAQWVVRAWAGGENYMTWSGRTLTNVTFQPVTGGAEFYINSPSSNVTNLTIRGPDEPGYTMARLKTMTIGTLTIQNTAPNRRVIIYGESFPSTLTINAVSGISDTDFCIANVTGGAAPISGTRLRILPYLFTFQDDITGVTESTFTPRTLYWRKPEGGSAWDTAWATTPGGVPSADNFPMPADTLVIDDDGLMEDRTIFLAPLQRYPYALPFLVRSVDMSARTLAMTLEPRSGNEGFALTGDMKFPTTVAPRFGIYDLALDFCRKDSTEITLSGRMPAEYSAADTIVRLRAYRSSNVKLMTDVLCYEFTVDGTAAFNGNGFNVRAIDLASFNGTVTFGSGLYTAHRFLLNGATESSDLESARFEWRSQGINGANLFANSTGRRVGSIKAAPEAAVQPTVPIIVTGPLPKRFEFVQNDSHAYTVQFRDASATASDVSIDSFVAEGPVGGYVTILGAPTRMTHSGAGSVNVNRAILDALYVSPPNTWFATNSTNSGSTGWTLSAGPAITAADGDNVIAAGQAGVSVTGTNLTDGENARLRYGSAVLNVASYTGGATPTLEVPSMASIFASGVRFGAVELEIMENV